MVLPPGANLTSCLEGELLRVNQLLSADCAFTQPLRTLTLKLQRMRAKRGAQVKWVKGKQFIFVHIYKIRYAKDN